MYKQRKIEVHPILKWAGGKTQLLPVLIPKIPKSYARYVEPFFGGGALYFAIQPEHALISDSNPELVNMYQAVANDVEGVIKALSQFENTKECFLRTRALRWESLDPVLAAARMIYLNRTCYNGLYRVNRKGEFNTPFGAYRNPKICDAENLRRASRVLKRAEIRCADCIDILDDEVKAGDFVFLDPPYVPVGKYGDFKRYTKEQFGDADQVRLADAVGRLHRSSVYAILTNSNHPRVMELYSPYEIEVEATKRNISCRSGSRMGEDAIVTIRPKSKKIQAEYESCPQLDQVGKYPKTRYMGSKRKLIDAIWDAASGFEFNSVLDLFSGSGIVGYMFKAHGKRVFSNDYMHMSSTFAKAMIENNSVKLTEKEARALLKRNGKCDSFVEEKFRGLYFADEENRLIDTLRCNIARIKDEYKRAIAMAALVRACTKRRPRGLFTYTGLRYDDGRRDLRIPFDMMFLEAVEAINGAVFDNGKDNKALNGDALEVNVKGSDLVYIDPPYFTPGSDNEYVRRYHFLEGLARDWKGVEIQENTETKKFKSYPTPFSTRNGASSAFDRIFNKFKNSILIVSYSSNSLPTKDEMIKLMKKYKANVEVVPIDYRYHFGNRSDGKVKRDHVQEFLFIGY